MRGTESWENMNTGREEARQEREENRSKEKIPDKTRQGKTS